MQVRLKDDISRGGGLGVWAEHLPCSMLGGLCARF